MDNVPDEYWDDVPDWWQYVVWGQQFNIAPWVLAGYPEDDPPMWWIHRASTARNMARKDWKGLHHQHGKPPDRK